MIKLLRKIFNREKIDPREMGKELGVMLVHDLIHEPKNFQPFMMETFDEKERIDFFVELIIIFIAVADRFAHKNFNEKESIGRIRAIIP